MTFRLASCALAAAALLAASALTPASAAAPASDAGSQAVVKVSTGNAEGGSSGFAEKRACDTKWSAYKSENKVHGWKAYFTFMAGCM